MILRTDNMITKKNSTQNFFWVVLPSFLFGSTRGAQNTCCWSQLRNGWRPIKTRENPHQQETSLCDIPPNPESLFSFPVTSSTQLARFSFAFRCRSLIPFSFRRFSDGSRSEPRRRRRQFQRHHQRRRRGEEEGRERRSGELKSLGSHFQLFSNSFYGSNVY